MINLFYFMLVSSDIVIKSLILLIKNLILFKNKFIQEKV